MQAIDRDLNYSQPASIELTVVPPFYLRAVFLIPTVGSGTIMSVALVILAIALTKRRRQVHAYQLAAVQELQDAREMQLSLLPEAAPTVEGIEIAGRSITANTDMAKISDKWLAVVDGKEGKQYDEISTPIFSPDSERVAYMAKISDKWLAVVDGREGKQYDEIRSLTFSPDSKRVAYVVEVDGMRSVVMDEKEGKQYDNINTPIFSPDSKRVAYVAAVSGMSFVVVDEKEFNTTSGSIGVGIVVFDSSNTLHYLNRTDNSTYLVKEEMK